MEGVVNVCLQCSNRRWSLGFNFRGDFSPEEDESAIEKQKVDFGRKDLHPGEHLTQGRDQRSFCSLGSRRECCLGRRQSVENVS